MIIVIPEYGQREYTNNLIDSIPSPYRACIYVGNDGYTEPQPPLHDDVHEVTWPDNLHFAANVNRTVDYAWAHSGSDYKQTLMVINSDVTVIGRTIQTLNSYVWSTQCLVGPAIVVPDMYANKNSHRQLFTEQGVKEAFGIKQMTTISGAFMCMPLHVWHMLDGFDSDTFTAYFEDDDLCIRAHLEGIDVIAYLDAVVKHQVSVTYGESPRKSKLIKESLKAFKHKHKGIHWDHSGMYKWRVQ